MMAIIARGLRRLILGLAALSLTNGTSGLAQVVERQSDPAAAAAQLRIHIAATHLVLSLCRDMDPANAAAYALAASESERGAAAVIARTTEIITTEAVRRRQSPDVASATRDFEAVFRGAVSRIETAIRRRQRDPSERAVVTEECRTALNDFAQRRGLSAPLEQAYPAEMNLVRNWR